MQRLEGHAWPDAHRFPVNRAGAHVRDTVWDDLARSHQPLLVAGYSSIDRLIALVADRRRRLGEADDVDGGRVRLLLGAEPFPTTRRSFAAPDIAFTEEVRHYWLEERGISLHLSAMVLQAIDELDAGLLTARFVHGQTTLHAKVYVGDDAATVGSSNFTDAGLRTQLEANARFERTDDTARYDELRSIAEHLWSEGQPWDDQLRALLEALLRVVPWQEALARACAELLEGEWAERYLRGLDAAGQGLWPSQRAGIAQALWIAENVGSVLVADATGSGKTRMGAHLVRAVRDRLWSTGRVRRDLTVLVCPPGVETTWQAEAISCGLSINTVSHGLLSRRGAGDERVERRGVRSAQILAVDEAHNFLNPDSNRTQQVRESQADHVALFTATPINRGAADLLRLIALLGADNFEEATLAVLKRLERTRGDVALAADEVAQLRGEIQRFTVRRTKSALNALVDREPDAYVHPVTGRVCRYPRHDSRVYGTGETAHDDAVAAGIRTAALTLRGVALLPRQLEVPATLRREYTDERWLQLRLASSAGLAAHHVLSAMRSSRAALVEHVRGTAAAAERFGIDPRYKSTDTGNVLGRLDVLAGDGPPAGRLGCDAPAWMTNGDAWRAACVEERERFEAIAAAADRLSDARERAKAALLRELGERHALVLAFDRHLVTLSVLEALLADTAPGLRVLVATGGDARSREQLTRVFDRASSERAVALCSDAMNEGLNLQGASAIVHLDLPTTLRVAEQRVGRVDRMDSPHDAIEAWWPDDGPAFATNANELLVQRAAESERLLGSNLPVPEQLSAGGGRVDVQERIKETESTEAELWDGIRDALDPVRRLVEGDRALVPRAVYEQHRTAAARVAARVSPVRSATAFAFLAVAGNAHGAPRWVFLASVAEPPIVDLERVSDALVRHLRHDPEGRPLDDAALALLSSFLEVATRHERLLLPRRMQRALEQMASTTAAWAATARRAGDERSAATWLAIGRSAANDADERPDPYLVAERWLEVVAPLRERYRDEHRHAHYVLLRDLDRSLRAEPLDLTTVSEAFSALPLAAPLAERVTSCILGVPGDPQAATSAQPAARHHASR